MTPDMTTDVTADLTTATTPGMIGAPPDLAAWATLARGWPVELGPRWLAAEWARVTPRSALAFADRAGASWMLVDGREDRQGYVAYDLLLDGNVDDALRDAGRAADTDRERCQALRERAAALRRARTATITTTSCNFPGLVWDVDLTDDDAARAIRAVVERVMASARLEAAAVLAVAGVPDTARFAPVHAALAGLGLIRADTAPDTELAVPPGGLPAYMSVMRTAVRREQRAFAHAVDRVVIEDASRLLAPDLVPLLAAQRRKYGHVDTEAAFRDRLARVGSYGDDVKVLVAEHAGRALGFTAVVIDRAHRRLVPRLFACEDNSVFVYFNLAFYEPVRAAALWGLDTIALGSTAYRAKLLRGAQLAPRSTWFAPLDEALRGILEQAAAYRSELEAARRDALAVLER
jgi:hypothetical protein